MSMAYKRQFEIIQRAKGELASMHREMIKNHWTHDEWLAKYGQFLDRLNQYKKLPYHQKEYLRGFASALTDTLYYVHIEWMHKWNDELYSDWDKLPEEAKEAQRNHTWDCAENSGFYWIGTNKPFSINDTKIVEKKEGD